MRDQKAHRAHLERQAELDAAVHVPARERVFVTDHDDAAADAVRVPLEIRMPAQAEIEDFRDQPRRRGRAQERRARKRNAGGRISELRGAPPPTWIVHRIIANLCARHGREPLPGERQRRGFACRAGQAAAQIAQRLEIGPHQRVAGIGR